MYEFIAISSVSKELKKSALLLKELDLNVLIVGEGGVGKKSLSFYITNQKSFFNAQELQQDIDKNRLTLNQSTIVIDKIDKITNIDLILKWIETKRIRVIATCEIVPLNSKLMKIFSLTLKISPLSERQEDIKPLVDKFTKEASKVFKIKHRPSKLIINTTNNAHSLRKYIYFSYLFDNLNNVDIMMLLENYMEEKMQGENAYRDLLYLFEVPLLKVAKQKFKSQVQMSNNLGLNRITLRKKIDNNKEYL